MVASAYLYDGSVEGLLSAVFLAYERREDPEDIVREGEYQPRIGQESTLVETCFDRAQRVRRGIERRAGSRAFTAVLRAASCEQYETGTVVYRFIRHVMSREVETSAKPALDDLANPIVADFAKLERHAINETEHMRQFIRFSHLENGVWLARCAPNASVVPFVMGYFAGRLNDQPFIIYDERHHIAGVYDGARWQLVSGEVVAASAETSREREMQEAWKRFYDALSVDARYNPELRRHFIPSRLWSTLTEFQPRRSS